MDCVVIAGGLAGPDDPIYKYTQGKPKAILDMNGRTMLERVIDALQDAKQIDDIVVVGLGSDMGMTFKRPVHHLPDNGSLVRNGLAGLRWIMEQKPDTTHVFGSTGDVPLMTGEMIDYFIESSQPFDHGIYYNFVTEDVLEKRFPHSTRTYVKLKGLNVAGGDIGIMGTAVLQQEHLLETLSNARKHAWKIARIVGLRMLLKLIFRQVSIKDIEDTAERLTGVPVKVVMNPHAEIGMDADKPEQVELCRRELVKLEGDAGVS